MQAPRQAGTYWATHPPPPPTWGLLCLCVSILLRCWGGCHWLRLRPIILILILYPGIEGSVYVCGGEEAGAKISSKSPLLLRLSTVFAKAPNFQCKISYLWNSTKNPLSFKHRSATDKHTARENTWIRHKQNNKIIYTQQNPRRPATTFTPRPPPSQKQSNTKIKQCTKTKNKKTKTKSQNQGRTHLVTEIKSKHVGYQDNEPTTVKLQQKSPVYSQFKACIVSKLQMTIAFFVHFLSVKMTTKIPNRLLCARSQAKCS